MHRVSCDSDIDIRDHTEELSRKAWEVVLGSDSRGLQPVDERVLIEAVVSDDSICAKPPGKE